MKPDGSDLRQLTRPGGSSSDAIPGYSPDGKKIVFVSNRLNSENSLDIFTMNADGSNIPESPEASPWAVALTSKTVLGRIGVQSRSSKEDVYEIERPTRSCCASSPWLKSWFSQRREISAELGRHRRATTRCQRGLDGLGYPKKVVEIGLLI
jgi:hypothetical protein